MIICLKSIRTDLQNMKFIEQLLSEIQLKYRYTIIEWKYTSAKYDLAVGHPKNYPICLKFCKEDHSIYYYVSIKLSFLKYVHV